MKYIFVKNVISGDNKVSRFGGGNKLL